MPTEYAEHTVEIAATPERVWDVLTLTRYISQWDDVPAGFLGERVALGTELTWPGHATLSYTVYDPPTRLYASLRVHAWERPPAGPVGYEYVVTATGQGARLSLPVGDFAHVPDGAQFREASEEFVTSAAATSASRASRPSVPPARWAAGLEPRAVRRAGADVSSSG